MENKPISASASSDNAHIFWCEPNEQRRHYYACLWLKDAFDAGRISVSDPYSDCARAIFDGKCTALRMREEELTACKAIYFTDKSAREDYSESKVTDEESYKRGWKQVGVAIGKDKPEVKRASHVAAKGEQSIAAFNATDSITKAVKTDREVRLQKIQEAKKKIVEIAKTDIEAAKRLLEKVKSLEQQLG